MGYGIEIKKLIMQKKAEETRMLKTKAIDSFFVLAIRRIFIQAVQTVS